MKALESGNIGSVWRGFSLRLRLTFSFAVAATLLLLALLPAVYHLIRGQMLADLDRQLRIDWALIEAHLEKDPGGGVRWRSSSPATPASPGYAESWFDVWDGNKRLLDHWPARGGAVLHPPHLEASARPIPLDLRMEDGRPARALQKPTWIEGDEFILRVFRDESGNRATLRRILIGLAIGMPAVVLLAAVVGYLAAGRALRPVADMATEARKITSESLGHRLPNPNPHDELGQLATVFNQTLERLEASFESLRRFTSDASHEMRTPLTALRCVGEVALREPRDAAALRETISTMLEEGQRLQELTDTLLTLARVEGGRVSLQPESLKLDDLAREACESLEVLASEKKQTISLEAASSPVVLVDRLLLRHAILNLVHNAIRYSPPSTTIRVRTGSRNGEAILEVADEGPGIPIEHRERIFERFHRVDTARSRAEGGAGLGLAIAKLLVERNGGRIELDCPAEGGSCFRIVLPAG